jgi:CubicO group peptidase (beta-lactamase class C family)
MPTLRLALLLAALTAVPPLASAWANRSELPDPSPPLDKLTQLIAEHTERYNFRGTILVERDGETLHHQSYGLANFTFEVPNHNDTKYKVASITKSFTATLVLMLVEQGKLRLDAPIATYLPDYTGEGADRVTLHHLLTHTSGRKNMEAFGVEMFAKPWSGVYGKPHTMDQIVQNFCSGPLVDDPGTTFDYDNGEFILLGRAIEAVTGKTYEEVLRDHILEPLQLHDSCMLNHAVVVPGLADTYSWNRDAQRLDIDLTIIILANTTRTDMGYFASRINEVLLGS